MNSDRLWFSSAPVPQMSQNNLRLEQPSRGSGQEALGERSMPGGRQGEVGRGSAWLFGEQLAS